MCRGRFASGQRGAGGGQGVIRLGAILEMEGKLMLYVISYDISVDKRRSKLARLLEGFGQRVQWSVFECDLSQAQYTELQRKIARILKHDEGDSLRTYRLCAPCSEQLLIQGRGPTRETTVDVLII